jgi:hypothetical protein
MKADMQHAALKKAGCKKNSSMIGILQNFFPLLGVQPMIGRSFTVEECQRRFSRFSTPPAVLLSYGFWQRRFASDPAVVGRKLTLNNKPVMVVGVLPCVLRFRERFCARHSGGCVHSMAPD